MSRSSRQGFTLIEVIVAVGILAMISSLVYGSLSVTLRSQRVVMRSQERYHAGRVALSLMTRDLSSAFLSRHVGLMERVTQTIFLGSSDEVTFTYLGHTRIFPKRPESDQGVVSYYLKSSRGRKGSDLIRREKVYIDDRPEKGGDELVLAEGVKELEFEYWDREQEDWTDSWKAEMEDFEPVTLDADMKKLQNLTKKITTGKDVDEDFRLPPRIRIRLVLHGDDDQEIPFESQVELRMKEPLQW